MTKTLPKIGSVIHFCLPGGIERDGRILWFDQNREMVFVRWVHYDLPDEWVPVRHL